MHFPSKPFQDCSNSPRPLDHSSQKVSQLFNLHFIKYHSLSKIPFYFLLLIALWSYYYLEEINSQHISEKGTFIFWEYWDEKFAIFKCTPLITLNLKFSLIY